MEIEQVPGTAEPVTQARVTNKNTFAIKDRYDGKDYVFPPNKPVRVPMDVAAHCFGFHPWPGMTQDEAFEAMLRYCAIRHGWNNSKLQDEGTHIKYFENLDIVPITMHLVERSDEPIVVAGGKKV